MKVKEAVELINNGEFYSIFDAEEEIEMTSGISITNVARDIDIEHHRWFDESSSFYKLEDGILGHRGVSRISGETSRPRDIGWETSAFEGEEFTTISYRRKI